MEKYVINYIVVLKYISRPFLTVIVYYNFDIFRVSTLPT